MATKLKILFWAGIVLIFIPFIGVGTTIKHALTILIGALVLWIVFRMRKHYKELRFKLRKFEEPTAVIDQDIHIQ